METFVVIGQGRGEIVEKKSRFIATIKEIHSEQEALDFIDALRKQYWDARHNCYAYVIGRKNEIRRFSDDKEPSGTAGKPILDVLLAANVRNAAIVVTRYFGGVLLGTGGLVRAYTDSSLAGLEALKNPGKNSLPSGRLLKIREGRQIKFTCDYKDISRFESLAERLAMATVSRDYAEAATYTMIVEAVHLETFMEEAMNITRGAFALSACEDVTYCMDGRQAVIYEF
ncbi:MAG: YigZ family protein [Lachnospiraceae bacterium]|jgi:uncharacterized YigZ family protein